MNSTSGLCAIAFIVISAASLAACGAEPTGAPTQPSPNITANPNAAPVEAEEGARAIAEGFVRARGDVSALNDWSTVTVGAATPLVRRDGTVVAFEFEVLAAGSSPAGFVIVEARREFEPVPNFATQGVTNTVALRLLFADTNPGRTLDGRPWRVLYNGPHALALEVTLDEGNVAVVTPGPEVSPERFDDAARVEQARTQGRETGPGGESVAAERNRQREALRSGEGPSVPPVKVVGFPTDINSLALRVASGAASFSNFVQEVRTWNSSNSTTSCYTGCTPVAWGIVLEYWDRNGYSSMISTNTDNSNTTHMDPDVRWMLNELRWNLRTSCVAAGGEGSTLVSNAPRVVDHVNTRGVGRWSSSNSSFFTWSTLTGEINAGRPAVVHYDANHRGGALNHSVAAYEYTDNWGSSNDWICAEKGWYTSGTTWDCFTPASAGNYIVTTLVPPSR